jgi:hypothetical protein
MSAKNHLARVPRWLAGACGGFAVAVAQIIGQNYGPKVADFITHGEWQNAMTMMLTVIMGILVLMALGSIVALFGDEDSRHKLFLMGVAVPALFTAAMPSVLTFVERKVEDHAAIAMAKAAEPTLCDHQNDLTFVQGLMLFFGANEPRYRVIVGSFKNPDDAGALVAKLDAEAPSIHAFVGQPEPCNPFYAVIVSQYLPANEAKRIQDKVTQLNSVTGAYLSLYPFR